MPDEEIALTAFRLLTKDLLDLFAVMNEAVMNVLSHYFELSKVDAEHAITIYKTFAKQTDQVVQYLSIARQYEHITKLEIPKIKHAPTSLAASLQEYIDDNDFEINRRQYLAEQQSKGGIKSGRAVRFTSSKPAQPDTNQVDPPKSAESAPTQSQTKAPAPDLIDFFGSLDLNQQPMAQQAAPVQQFEPAQQYAQPIAQDYPQPYAQPPVNGMMATGQTTNPFMQAPTQQLQPPQQAQPQAIQPQFTGAGFGGYGPQPPQQQPQQTGFSSSNPFQSDMSQQQYPQQVQQPFITQQPQPEMQLPQIQQPPQQPIQPQSTNPFRQSMMLTGQTTGYAGPQQQQQQSTNPFARPSVPQPTGQFGQSPQQLQPQPTGTNPFARAQQPQQTGSSASFLTPSVTGSTNPFRQSAFVNQQTGTGWQNAGQGTMGGWEQLETQPIFPRPGQA